MLNKGVKAPIQLAWRAECDVAVNNPVGTSLTCISIALHVNTVDKRIRRKPITRSTDFLWED
jgi:hypothetical protein